MTPIGDIGGFQAGLALGAASMASIGPNNLMMMREGLMRGRTGFVASLVWGSYVVLIMAAYFLAGPVARLDPAMRTIFGWSGLLAMAWFAWLALRGAATAGRAGEHIRRVESARTCVLRVMRVVWMNPLTYVELLFIPAALCQSFTARDARLQFILALILMAALCCCAYAIGGDLVAAWLSRRKALRAFDLVSGLLLSGVAISMAVTLLSNTP
jgi:arginine exporter protein ArgO